MKYFDELTAAIRSENFFATDEILSLIKENDSIEYTAKLLAFMEENPLLDYGMPGPVVHYMERYYRNGYEDLLYESIKRKPTPHTLWMLNRILNSPTLEKREKYFLLLKSVAENSEDAEILDMANSYLKYQLENN